MRFVKPLSAVVFALSTLTFAQSAQALPMTYTFTGTVGYSYAGGDLSGIFSDGQSFTLTAEFDPAVAPSFISFDTFLFAQYWWTGNRQTVSVNGHTFSIDGRVLNNGTRTASITSYFGRSDLIEQNNNDTTAGGATSSYAGVTQIASTWRLISSGGRLSDISPNFPPTINLSDWNRQYFDFQLFSLDGYASFTVYSFASVTSSSGGPVPTPGALALLGFGLLGVGAARRMSKAA